MSARAATGEVMRDKKQLIPIAGLVGTMAISAYMVTQLSGQGPAPAGDFTNAAVAEVRDAHGQVVLRGQFVVAEEEDDDVERKATLEPTGIDDDAAGQAEVELARANPVEQEIEFSVRDLQAGAAFTFVIDGIDVATATADQRGRAEVELEIKMPGATATR
jgi:hypothetical protein